MIVASNRCRAIYSVQCVIKTNRHNQIIFVKKKKIMSTSTVTDRDQNYTVTAVLRCERVDRGEF